MQKIVCLLNEKNWKAINLSLIEILQTKEEYYLQLKKIMDKNN